MAKTYEDFLAALRQRESSGNYSVVNTLGFLGAYQFGEGPLIDLGFVNTDGNYHDNDFSGGWTGRLGIDSAAEFLASPEAQDAAADAWFPLVWSYLTALGAEAWLGQTVAGIEITASGLIAGAHLLGASRVVDWLQSDGTTALEDAYGTPISEYINQFSGYTMPFDTGEQLSDPTAEIIAAVPTYLESRVSAVLADNPEVILGADGTDDTLDGTNGSDVVAGGTGADRLTGFGGRDVLIGGGQGDRLEAGGGRDLLVGGNGNDVVLGQAGFDRLYGNAGADRLFGGNGNDRMFGGNGDDVVNGGTGNDILFGGGGADIFVFSDGFGRDIARDFDPTEGDQLRLAGVAAITGYDDLVQKHMHQDGANVVIDTGTGDVLTLGGVDLHALDASHFLF